VREREAEEVEEAKEVEEEKLAERAPRAAGHGMAVYSSDV
jgi:hypothetical protein